MYSDGDGEKAEWTSTASLHNKRDEQSKHTHTHTFHYYRSHSRWEIQTHIINRLETEPWDSGIVTAWIHMVMWKYKGELKIIKFDDNIDIYEQFERK